MRTSNSKRVAQVFSVLMLLVLVYTGVVTVQKLKEEENASTQTQVELKNQDARSNGPTPKEDPKPKEKVLASTNPYNDGSDVLNDKGKIEMWQLLERQRETLDDYDQILEARKIMTEVLAKCDTNVFLLQVTMDALDSLEQDQLTCNRELIGIDADLIYYRFYMKETQILKE